MNNNKRPLYIPYAGPALLSTPLLNKGSAFSTTERNSELFRSLHLNGQTHPHKQDDIAGIDNIDDAYLDGNHQP